MKLDCAGRIIDLSSPRIMGILNVTPDSFSDGGLYNNIDSAIQRARQMVDEGADIIDVGGESTRPGAEKVSIEEELARTIPVIQRLSSELDVCISIDSSKPEVMREAVAAGAGFINDVNALQAQNAVTTVAELRVPVCLMHMQNNPQTMQQSPRYDNVVKEVVGFLGKRITECKDAGIRLDKIIIDPGFGFGKTLEHNYQLLAGLDDFQHFNLPILIGVSRKSMLGNLLEIDINERIYASIAAALIGLQKGATILRVHDVKATMDAVRVFQEVRRYE